MKYALITDIHANLPALEAVLADIDRRGDVDAIYQLGDIVGYCPWPNETVALLRLRSVLGVAGNYDSTTATDYKHCGCKYENPRQEELSHQSYTWTKAHVTSETKRYLGSLPFRLDLVPAGAHLTTGSRIVLVHGTPTINTLYWTDNRPDTFFTQMAQHAGLKAGDSIAFGHTHQMWHRVVEEVHFVNAGTVGRPKDGDPRARYVVLDATDGIKTEFVHVEYDVERAVRGILDSELPDEFAEFLQSGGARPSELASGAAPATLATD